MALDRGQPRSAHQPHRHPRGRASFRLFRRRHARSRGRAGVRPLLRFESVSLRRGGRLLFEGLDLTLGPGEALQISGPNGSGKSSLIRLAAGLLREERGRVDRSPLALADDNIALDRELPLRRALAFWGGAVAEPMKQVGIALLADVPVRLLSSGQLKR